LEDSAIIGLYHSRDESAIGETDRKFGHYLTIIAYNVLADYEDCKETVNDTYLAAWNSIPPHKPNNLSAFLGKIARRIAVDKFRKRTSLKRGKSQFALSLSELSDCAASDSIGGNPVSETESKLLGERIRDWLNTLSEETRCIFVGRYFYHDSVKTVAEYYGMSESKVKSLLYRARIELKKYLEKEGFSV
jgi:RNA polymerase sigma-70 factor (ECF subfamily)